MPNTTLNYKNYRSNSINSTNGRPTSGHCIECGRLTNIENGGKRVTIPSQKNGVWVCTSHRGSKNLHDYSEENYVRVGKGNADGITISVELESKGKSTSARAYFVKNHFLPTYDSTVDIEYKSPIYTSELPLAKIIGAVEYMDKNPNYQFSVNNEDCGIHTHYGFIDNHYDFRNLRNHYEKLFRPLENIIKNELTFEQREAVFGRSYDSYNRKLDFDYPDRHENWINIQHSYSLEIRMPRFNSANQYMRFLKCFKKIFKALSTHYINRGCTERAAIKTGEKLAKIFKQEYSEYFTVNTGVTVTTNNTRGINAVIDNNGTIRFYMDETELPPYPLVSSNLSVASDLSRPRLLRPMTYDSNAIVEVSA